MTTGPEGRYVFANVVPGLYHVRVEANGFTTQEFTDVRLEVGRTVTLDATLEVAPIAQVVTVSGGGAGIELVESEVQAQITSTTVENIPLNGRNFLELAFLLPGNRPGQNYDPTKTNTLEVSSAGQMGRGGNITVDGGDNNDEVVGGTLMNFPQDGVQEFQIATNRYTAEVGRSASSIINIITKSGSNEYHGSAFFFFRHRELQGRAATLAPDAPTPSFDREQFGGSIGGPIRGDKAWWFFSLENRNQDAAIQVGERDFATQTTPTTSALAPLDDFMLLGRADFKVSDSDDMYARYAFNRSEEVAAGSSIGAPIGSAANRQSSLNRFQSILYSWTRAISPTKVNNFTFHVNTFINSIPAFGENEPTTNPSGLGIVPEGPAELVFPALQDGANFRIPQRTRMPRYQAKDNFSWVRGKHTVRFGGEWQRAGSDILFDIFGSGSTFLAEDFATADLTGDGQINDADIPIVFVLRSAAPERPPTAPRNWSSYLGFYIQDDWKVRANLTLNMGLRWDFDTDVFGEGPLHDPCPEPLDVQPTEPCLWVRGPLGLDRNRGYKNLGPKFGFAWDPFSRGKTIIRGGYGIYYDRVTLEVKILEQFVNGRTIAIGSLDGSTCNAPVPPPAGNNTFDACFEPGAQFDLGSPTLADPFIGTQQAGGIGIQVLNNDSAHPMVQQWTLGVEHEIAPNWTVSADGIHNFGTRFIIGRPVRMFAGTPSSPHLSVDAQGFLLATDPLTGRTDGISEFNPGAKMWYDGLLARFKKRPTRHGNWGYGFDVNYTLSKTLNYANDDQIIFLDFNHTDVVLGQNNLRLEKGLAPNDERHRLVFFGVFELPYDFKVSPIWTLTSNVPMDGQVPGLGARLPILARNALGGDVKTGAELNEVITKWNGLTPCDPMDTFPRSTTCRVGGVLPLVNPNLRFGDSFNALDVRVSKAFVFGERHRIELIGEVFNLFNVTNIRGFNRANFSGFNNNITSPAFNTSVSTAGGFFGSGGPRAFQFAARYSF